MNLRDIQIRDPFILREGNRYYLFGSTDKDIWQGEAQGFDVYVSDGDLAEFEGPFPAFRPPRDFWSVKNFWAPEVHPYQGFYYMFATFKPKEGRRGTAILRGDKPLGPFIPWSTGPVTPPDWECLDGTLYVDENGRPWMVFCHEWVQVGDGEMNLIPLSADLKTAAGEPTLLFRASEAPWAAPLSLAVSRNRPGCYVTDGPNFYRAENGRLLLLWSSFNEAGSYCIGAAVSETGLVTGPWKQEEKPIFSGDGGHGMIFRSPEGKRYLAVHTPNQSPRERAIFIEMIDREGRLSPAGPVIRS
ncbi:MAG: glycoside hydrolase family 43 protein [Treponema sp.]|jgi:GH43 family beta-xylosidase|nr:glycoside hydrolase family 43 protein [Treponema sp.]